MTIPKELKSLDLEKSLLAGIIQYPDVYFKISSFITERDFTTRLHKFIYKCTSILLDGGKEVSNIVIADKIRDFNATFEDDISVIDYLDSITLVGIKESNLMEVARRVGLKTFSRSIWKKGQDISKYVIETSDDTYDDIMKNSDLLYHKFDKNFNTGFEEAENIFEDYSEKIEEFGNNAGKEIGLFGPHDLMNGVYGSICRPGNVTIIAARSGVGKMNPLYTKVLTSNGFCEMREIRVGSKVICPDGKTANVTATFNHFQKDIYRVYMSDGRFVDCGLEHLWRVWARNRFGEYSWQTVDTDKIICDLKQVSKRVYIPLIKDTHENKKDFVVHPYIVGALIGDGCLTDGYVIESADEFIPLKIQRILGDSITYSNRSSKKSKSKTYRFFPKERKYFNQLIKNLKIINLYGKRSYEKRIPKCYFEGSLDQKIDLIQGMMDTDGTLSKSCGRNRSSSYGSLCYSTSSKGLAKDFQKLIWSIGGIAKISSKRGSYKNKDGGIIECRISYKVSIRYKNPKVFFSLPRKANLAPNEEEYQYHDLKLQILKIEKILKKEDCRCIKIDHPEHLYIIDDCVVTHNTQWMMNYGMKLSDMHDIPVLHLDNGEMSQEELLVRAAASLSGVSSCNIEDGSFRKNEKMLKKIRDTYPYAKELKYYYYNVAGKTTETILNFIRKFYFTHVGRGNINKMVTILDYLKIGMEKSSDQNWIDMGELLIKIKNFIRTEVPIGIIAGLQTNRLDITTNKHSKDLPDNESVMGLSDLIFQNASHVFHLRKKTIDELLDEDQKFGEFKMFCQKNRHLGKDRMLELKPTVFPDNTIKKFWINFDIDNFSIKEAGSSVDVASYMRNKLNVNKSKTVKEDGATEF